MYLYKIFTYVIDNNTTLSKLQLIIEKDVNISINQQILTDYYGNILRDDIPVLAQIDVRINIIYIVVYEILFKNNFINLYRIQCYLFCKLKIY